MQQVNLGGISFEPERTADIDTDGRLSAILAGKPRVRLETDENGHAVVDKNKHPRLYDWAVHG